MAKEEELKILSKVSLVLLILVLVVILTVVYLVIWPIFKEWYCQGKAKNIAGDRWNVLMIPNGEEKKLLNYKEKGEITLGFREQLKCEKKLKLFFTF